MLRQESTGVASSQTLHSKVLEKCAVSWKWFQKLRQVDLLGSKVALTLAVLGILRQLSPEWIYGIPYQDHFKLVILP
ncbi:MAG: hypothetical protein ACI9C3_002662, partial [Yoonia sp.]